MKNNLILLTILFTLSCTNVNNESDIIILKGTWESTEENDDDLGSLKEVLGQQTLEIIDEENCQLTFFGVKALGKMKINEKSKTMEVLWKGEELKFSYNLRDKQQITLNINKGKFIFEKVSSESKIRNKSIQNIKLTKQALIGEWKLSGKRGGGKDSAMEFMTKESGAVYNFMNNEQVEIKYRNGEIETGIYMFKNNNEILIGSGNKLKKYICKFYKGDEIRLKNTNTKALITLERKEQNSELATSELDIKKVTSKNGKSNTQKIEHYRGRYTKLRKELRENYDGYIKTINTRPTGNGKAFIKIKEDLKFLKESESLEEFIDTCPRVNEEVLKEYFEGMEMILGPIRKDTKN